MIDFEKLEGLKKYIKYIILIVILLVTLLIIRGCRTNYNSLEIKVKEAALDYVNKNNLNVTSETYIELTELGEIEGTEMCSKASGAIVIYESGDLKVEPYLKCETYETKLVNNREKYASLNGSDVMILNYGETFNDPLYVLKTDANVVVTGEVKEKPGIYTLNYYVYIDEKLKETLTRKVIVTKSDKTTTISGITDLEKPTLTLNGDSSITLGVGEKYVEPGYKAVDYKDGKISRSVKVEPSKIDTSKAGTQTITYSVTNSRGVTAEATRQILVVNRKSNLSITVTSETNEIDNKATLKIVVTGSGFKYMKMLPSGRISYKQVETEPATHNGTYEFRVYDQYNNEYVKKIEVNNLDVIPPSGTCKATITDTTTKVEVNAIDNKGISGYSYILDGSATEFLKENTYETNKKSESVSVSVKDIVGNTGKINCEIEKAKVDNIMISGSCGTSDIYIDIKTCFGDKTIRANVPLEEYLLSVIYGESNDRNPEFVKTFVIFARTYTLNRIRYGKNTTYSIRSCDSDQNWCDVNMGCYREQTKEMFDLCINYAVNYPRPDYTADTCAKRVTTFPGSKNVGQPTFYVTNPNWPSDKAKSAVAVSNRSSWHGPLDQSFKELYTQVIQETAGLVIKTSDGALANVNYLECGSYSNDSTLCPTKAKDLANQGMKAGEIIAAYTKKYPNAKIECYNK